VIGAKPHTRNNAEYILQLKEELDKARATIEEQTKYLEDL
jgi:hypothetical protein